VEFGGELILKIDGKMGNRDGGGRGCEEIEKKRRTIPLSKHRCIGTNVLFQKFVTNFTHSTSLVSGKQYGSPA
jgi:hypothetical protein